jgi:positive regulator of sigma E activity
MDRGIIKKIIDKKTAEVTISLRGDCNSCAGRSSCGAFISGDQTIRARYQEGLKEGDVAEVEYMADKRVISSIIIFLVPLIILIGSYYLGFYLFKKELSGILFSMLGLALYVPCVMIILRIKNNPLSYLPLAAKPGRKK